MPQRQCTKTKREISKLSKRICIPVSHEEYAEKIDSQQAYRSMIDKYIASHPELFPTDIHQGYHLHGFRQQSVKMPDVQLRRICLKVRDVQGKQQVYTIAPSFVLPYMMGYVDDVEKALFLHSYGVPFSALSYVFGRNDMYWYRLVTQLGGNDIVGTTIKDPTRLPDHLLADEKHTRWCGEKVYIATTVGADCVLGASVSVAADEDHLTQAYGQVKKEAVELDATYTPQTVNTDGWLPTHLAWQSLFSTTTIIQCFLHAFITIRSRCKRLKTLFPTICQQVWDIYRAESVQLFRQGLDELRHWANHNLTSHSLQSVLKLCDKVDIFALAFEYPHAYRTSNMLDRHMEPMSRYLHSSRYFHGHLMSGEYRIRAWVLLHNFQPYCPRANIRKTYLSPFHKLNGFVYHQNWLQNLLVASSLGGRYATYTKR